MHNPTKKSFAVFLLIAVMAPLIAFPRPAQAFVPTWDAIQAALKSITTAIQSMFDPLTGVSSSVSTVAHDVPDSIKTFLVNPIVSQMVSQMIETAKNMAINSVVSGNFGGPTFVTDFQANLKDAGRNAARSFLSQLSGLDFCNFYPNPIQQRYTLSIQFNLQCRVNLPNYNLFLKYPWAFEDWESTGMSLNKTLDYFQISRYAASFRADEAAQNIISKAAQTAQGFLGITKEVVSQKDQNAYDEKVQAEIASCRQDYLEVNSKENPPSFELTPDQLKICDDSVEAIPRPKPTEKITTPGQAVSHTLGKAMGMDLEKSPHIKELSDAITEIVNIALRKVLTDGLGNVGL